MKAFIALLLIIGAVWGLRELIAHYDRVQHEKAVREGRASAPAAVESTTLGGLPPALESSLQTAQKQGANGLRNWLRAYRTQVKDPRLAAIELDYVVLLGTSNLKEARQVFAAVKQRTPTNSPVYARIRQLERSYQ